MNKVLSVSPIPEWSTAKECLLAKPRNIVHATDELLAVSPMPKWSIAKDCCLAKPRNIVHASDEQSALSKYYT